MWHNEDYYFFCTKQYFKLLNGCDGQCVLTAWRGVHGFSHLVHWNERTGTLREVQNNADYAGQQQILSRGGFMCRLNVFLIHTFKNVFFSSSTWWFLWIFVLPFDHQSLRKTKVFTCGEVDEVLGREHDAHGLPDGPNAADVTRGHSARQLGQVAHHLLGCRQTKTWHFVVWKIKLYSKTFLFNVHFRVCKYKGSSKIWPWEV